MDINLANQEKIVKSWDYATTKAKSGRSQSNLTITDKRIISTTKGQNINNRVEINVAEVKSFSARFAQPKAPLLALIIMLALGIASLVVGINKELTYFIAIGAALIVCGIIAFVFTIGKCNFTMQIFTKGHNDIGLSLTASRFFKIKRSRKIRIRVDKSCVNDIINTLGAVIVNLQNSEQKNNPQ